MIRYTFDAFRANRNYASIIDSEAQLRTPHTHDYFEISLVRSGACIHHINEAAQRLEVGCLNFIRPSDCHFYQPLTPDFSIINVLIPQETIHGLFNYLGNGFEPSRLLGAALAPLARMSMADFSAVQNELEQLMLYKKLLNDKADAMFHIALMNIITRHFPMALAHNHTDIPLWLRWLLLEMLKKENFSQGIEAMHRLCGKTPEHLARSCRRYLGMTPTRLINEIRLHHSAILLVGTQEKIIDICQEVGFDNLSNYYHLFQKMYGMTPKEFRRMQDTSRLKGGAIASVMLPLPIPMAPPPPEL